MICKKTLGIFGLGNFGLLLAKILKPYFKIKVASHSDKKALARLEGLEYQDLDKVLSCDYFIPAIPVQNLEDFIFKNKAKIPSSTTIIDVASVKKTPEIIYQKLLPKHQAILTHPLFGPNSFRENGYKTDGLKIVFCLSYSDTKIQKVFEFRQICEHDLKLKIFEYTPQKHDQEMSYVQGLTFYLGKIFEKMQIPDSPLSTPTYDHLLKIKQIVSSDSLELFKTIQEFNPESQKVIQKLIDACNLPLGKV